MYKDFLRPNMQCIALEVAFRITKELFPCMGILSTEIWLIQSACSTSIFKCIAEFSFAKSKGILQQRYSTETIITKKNFQCYTTFLLSYLAALINCVRNMLMYTVWCVLMIVSTFTEYTVTDVRLISIIFIIIKYTLYIANWKVYTKFERSSLIADNTWQ